MMTLVVKLISLVDLISLADLIVSMYGTPGGILEIVIHLVLSVLQLVIL